MKSRGNSSKITNGALDESEKYKQIVAVMYLISKK